MDKVGDESLGEPIRKKTPGGELTMAAWEKVTFRKKISFHQEADQERDMQRDMVIIGEVCFVLFSVAFENVLSGCRSF